MINKNYLNLKQSYLFSDIAKRVESYKNANPDKKIIRLGIGDVTLPLADNVVKAMQDACAEMGKAETFRGYGPEQGYSFLREKIKDYYKNRNIELDISDIFVSDGAKSDVANILDILDSGLKIAITNPVYPVYFDTNVMLNNKITFVNANKSNNFLPLPDKDLKADVIYICSPNNPTGAVYGKQQLSQWVDFALKNNALILFDAAYERFIQDPNLPRSIYEIEGAKECAIEICSLSKTAGFTGTRCGYTIVPSQLVFDDMPLNRLWLRRCTTKFNGTSYIIQRGAEAVFTSQNQIEQNIKYYMNNAKVLADALTKKNVAFTGGDNSPYIWLECPKGKTSWEYFDYLLNEFSIVGTPGSGFGEKGEGYFRLTAFNTLENTIEAAQRLSKG